VKNDCLVLGAVLTVLMFCAATLSAAEPSVFRSAENGRVWQVNLSPSEPITWAWSMGSDAAKLTVSNHCAKTVSEQVVTRTGDELFGSFALTVPAAPLEQVYTLHLEQFYHYGQDDQQTTSSDSARVAYLPGIQGNPIDVASVRQLRKVENPVVFAYDAAWSLDSATSTVASIAWSPVGGAAGVRVLERTSGFDTVDIGSLKKTNLTLSFDGTPYWTADVMNGSFGLLLLVR